MLFRSGANRGGRLWLSGKLVPTGKRPSGGVTILDLEQDPIAFFPNPIDVVQFYIPRMAFEEFAYENGTAIIDTLAWPHCGMDTTLKHLGMTVLSAIQRPKPAPKLFLDYIGQSILGHATYVYGGIPASPSPIRGHLAPWQARRAKEFLSAKLYGDVSLASVATECNLSVSHFAHAFRRTFGRPPHRWLMERRIDAVKNLLLTSRLTLAEVATQCGFADQSALSRSFKRVRSGQRRLAAPGAADLRASCVGVRSDGADSKFRLDAERDGVEAGRAIANGFPGLHGRAGRCAGVAERSQL